MSTLAHGHAKRGQLTATYRSWASMKMRCCDPAQRSYPSYGGAGVTICERWLESFENFLSDMGERPEGKTLDRIDTNGNYEPSNCRWATPTEQNNNRRPRYNGLTPDLVNEIHGRCEHGESQRSVARRIGVNETTISKIRRGQRWPQYLQGGR